MTRKGSSLVEVVIGAGILSVVALAFLGTLSTLVGFHQKDMLSIKGTLLAEEGIEAVRFIKGSGWTNLSSIPAGQDRYLALGPSSWSVSQTPEVVDGVFFRSFRLSPVMRNASDDIVSAGGTVDSDTFLVDVSVAWNWRGATTTAIYKAYVTNI